MIKRTLYFGTPYQIITKDQQLVCTARQNGDTALFPIEDIGFVILDNPETYISPPAIERLLANNVALVYCDQKRYPVGLVLPLEAHTLQSERFRAQIEASLVVKKQLWKQTIEAKIRNQAQLLKNLGKESQAVDYHIEKVKSGDSSNEEAKAARHYWQILFAGMNFTRDRYGESPNNLLNYGYAILRSAVARALVGSGLLPTLGIHHHNRYNAFCLADDIMEPYRPWVDEVVWQVLQAEAAPDDLSKNHKALLINVLTADVQLKRQKSPLMLALSETTASLARCFLGEETKINYPYLCNTKD